MEELNSEPSLLIHLLIRKHVLITLGVKCWASDAVLASSCLIGVDGVKGKGRIIQRAGAWLWSQTATYMSQSKLLLTSSLSFPFCKMEIVELFAPGDFGGIKSM